MSQQKVNKTVRSTLWRLFLLVLIVLLMVQVDRQWQRLDRMVALLQEQSEEMRRTRNSIRQIEQKLRQVQSEPGQSLMPSHAEKTTAAAMPHASAFIRARAAEKQGDYAVGGDLRLSFGSSVQTLTPVISSDAYASEVQSYVLESLLRRDPDTLQWQGLLAKSWEISADGLTMTFDLDPLARFSDGHPLTAHDVAFSYRFIMHDAIAAPRLRAYYKKVKAVTVLDDHRVRFTLVEPYFNSLALVGGMEILAEHFYGRFLKNPKAFNESRGLLFGSGPYRFTDTDGWSPDQQRIELERSPNYWGPVTPALARIEWRIIDNASACLTAFRNQEVDAYSPRPSEYQRLIAEESIQAQSQHFSYNSAQSAYLYIAWNQRTITQQPSRFADVRVRRAMSHLTDVQRIIDEIWQGEAEQVASPFADISPQHDPSITAVAFDLERARALLESAGYQDRNQDGVLEDQEGRPFEFELMFPQSRDEYRRMALLLRDIYARAGVVLKPVPAEWPIMLEKLNRRDFEAITLGWGGTLESDLYQIFHSSQVGDGADNFIHYQNKKLDALIEQARSAVDDNARMPLWHAAERILVEDQPYTFLLRPRSLQLVNKRIANVKPLKTGLSLMAVPVEVYIPAAVQ